MGGFWWFFYIHLIFKCAVGFGVLLNEFIRYFEDITVTE